MSEKTKNSEKAELGSAAAQKTAAPAKAVEQTATPAAQAAEVKPEPPTGEPKQAKPQTVEQRIEKVETLMGKVQSRGTIVSHLQRVTALKFGDFEERETLVIKTAKGEGYEIKSGSLCAAIQLVLKQRMLQEIAKLDAEINF